MSDYYLDPMMQIVHIALSIDAFSKNPSALAAELQLNGMRLHDRFLEYLKSCEATVKCADPEQVFQISFDLFPWTSERLH